MPKYAPCAGCVRSMVPGVPGPKGGGLRGQLTAIPLEGTRSCHTGREGEGGEGREEKVVSLGYKLLI